MNNYRWNPYALLSGEDLKQCFLKHFTAASSILIIMSKGFDIRMNIALEELKANPNSPAIKCLLINFDEGADSSSHQYQHLVDRNMQELGHLLPESNIVNANIQLWHKDGTTKRRIGDRRAAGIIDKINLSDYTDIIVDISALPRGIYFSMIGKLLTMIDTMPTDNAPNLMVTVAENPDLDMAIHDDTPDDEPNFLQGFSGQIDSSSGNREEPLIWMPILGENKEHYIRKAYNFLGPSETCPILPFPSRNPRRPDAIITSYHRLLFDEFIVEQQNIMYVPEQNPFEAYRILSNAIQNYHDSLAPIGDCKTVLSTFSSKLLSIGTLLTAYELKLKGIGVGVLNVDSQGYKMNENIDLEKMRKDSKLFVIWLTGEPYNETKNCSE
jgi:hypothetical protein